MTKAGTWGVVALVLSVAWGLVLSGQVATNDTVMGIMPFAPFNLLCCFGVSCVSDYGVPFCLGLALLIYVGCWPTLWRLPLARGRAVCPQLELLSRVD
jgi:hypothetical protein